MTTVLDHFAIGTQTLTDGWDLFGGVLGGTWAYGGDSRGYWWGQLSFAAGPKIELLTPTGGPDAAFLERFLAAHGTGPHHFNFAVDDIEDALARIRALGIEPVGVSLDNPSHLEAFLHPRNAHGIVIQIAQEVCSPRGPAPRELPEPGPRHPLRAWPSNTTSVIWRARHGCSGRSWTASSRRPTMRPPS